MLEESLRADVNIVETVAHMMAAVKYFGDVDVICDIGGQDIKVLFMANGELRNFRLSNQCSAGNGMLLQAMADQFGVPVTEYAETAFKARLSPKFSYGCAVFLDADRVNFQKEGYAKEELLAGLAMVLPKNVWQYVVQIPRMAAARYPLRPAGRHAVQPGSASRRRSITSRSACRTPRCTCIRIQAKRAPSARRSKRCASSSVAAIRRSSGSTPRSTCCSRAGNDESTPLSLLPERLLAHVHRRADARRPHEPVHLRLQL